MFQPVYRPDHRIPYRRLNKRRFVFTKGASGVVRRAPPAYVVRFRKIMLHMLGR